MKREFLTTGDGSVTIHLPEWNEQYHSKHGAIAEAQHVFIETGLVFYAEKKGIEQPLHILEIGFGTGLNALLTFAEAAERKLTVFYTGVEAHPVALSEVEKLNYATLISVQQADFLKLHETVWEEPVRITPAFTLTKRKQFFADIEDTLQYQLIYFDAFGARVQPELWTETIFKKMYDAFQPEGILVTYAANGNARRAMLAAGFTVEKLPGPPGKREMLRATKA